jgi:diguanylate cyclase (GGDEF)-like protein
VTREIEPFTAQSAPVEGEPMLDGLWEGRSRKASARELRCESVAAVLFVAAALTLLLAGDETGFSWGPAAILVGSYAIASRIEFQIGVGYVVPSQLVLVPMLLLMPPSVVPALAAAGLVAGALLDLALGRSRPERLLFSIPDAWHAVGPALVLLLAGAPELGEAGAGVLVLAFVACCAFDMVSAMLREAAALGIRPQAQLRVVGLVWIVDACLAPIGYLAVVAAGGSAAAVLFVAPLCVLLLILAKDRSRRIETAQRRLELVRHERSRLQAAVRRLGEAFAAKLDIESVMSIALRASVEALDADAGRLELHAAQDLDLREGTDAPAPWTISLPLNLSGGASGTITIARRTRGFEPDEVELLGELVEHMSTAATEILGHRELRTQVMTDQLTGLGNRRRLAGDLNHRFASSALTREPWLLALFDLDGFKRFNDSFGHAAGDDLLSRIGGRLSRAVAPHGRAFRLGGDEFCVVMRYSPEHAATDIAAAVDALGESGEGYAVTTSYGVVLLPHEAGDAEAALHLADQRMYAQKRGRHLSARRQAADALLAALGSRERALQNHAVEVGTLALETGRQLGLPEADLEELALAAELHDVGKIAIADSILHKPGPLSDDEWEQMRRHTVLGEQILGATDAFGSIAQIVRSSHERWDGSGYPDGLAGESIPLAARVVAVCDAFEAMTSDRPYRNQLPLDLATQELSATAGTQFDPRIVAAFLCALDGVSFVADARPASTLNGALQIAEQLRQLADSH